MALDLLTTNHQCVKHKGVIYTSEHTVSAGQLLNYLLLECDEIVKSPDFDPEINSVDLWDASWAADEGCIIKLASGKKFRLVPKLVEADP